MADPPLTLSVFEAFQQKVFERFDEHDRRFADDVTAVKEALALVEWKVDEIQSRGGELELRFEDVENRMAGVEASVLRLDERLSRVEKRLEDLAASGQPDTLRTEVQDLRARMDALAPP